MRAHRLAQDVYPNRVTTVCSCGDRLEAVGMDDQHDYVVGELGFDTIEAACEFHDHAHYQLANALGLPESPTLMRQTHGTSSYASDTLVAYEEAMVEAAARFVNCARREGKL